MKKYLIIILSVVLIFSIKGLANATIFTGQTLCEWGDVNTDDSLDPVWSITNNDDGADTTISPYAFFNFGVPAPDIGSDMTDCQFTADGIGSDATNTGTWTWDSDSPNVDFKLADFSYRNSMVTNSLGVLGVDLNVTLTGISPDVDPTDPVFDFYFDITNTTNVWDDETGDWKTPDSDDVVKVSSSSEFQHFTDGDGNTWGISLYFKTLNEPNSDEFRSPELKTAYGEIYADMHFVPPGEIPEPTTCLLLFFGLLGLIGIKKKIS